MGGAGGMGFGVGAGMGAGGSGFGEGPGMGAGEIGSGFCNVCPYAEKGIKRGPIRDNLVRS